MRQIKSKYELGQELIAQGRELMAQGNRLLAQAAADMDETALDDIFAQCRKGNTAPLQKLLRTPDAMRLF